MQCEKLHVVMCLIKSFFFAEIAHLKTLIALYSLLREFLLSVLPEQIRKEVIFMSWFLTKLLIAVKNLSGGKKIIFAEKSIEEVCIS